MDGARGECVPLPMCSLKQKRNQKNVIYSGMDGARGELPSAENLPEHWRAAVDEESGRVYYLNDVTKATQWCVCVCVCE